jgi:hypothetical protein
LDSRSTARFNIPTNEAAGYYRIITDMMDAATNAVLTRIRAVMGDGSQFAFDVGGDA